LQAADEKLTKSCEYADERTNSNQKVYRCFIKIEASKVSNVDRSSRYDKLLGFQKLIQSQSDYKDLAIMSGCTNDAVDCQYLANTKDDYCNLAVDYSFALNPPNDTVSYRLDCSNLPHVTQIPAGFTM
jgi:hypothetical protein